MPAEPDLLSLLQSETQRNAAWALAAFDGTPTSPGGPRLWVVHEDSPGDTKVNRASAGGPLRLGEQVFARGLGVNSLSRVRLVLPVAAVRFRAVIGLDRNVDNTPASVDFHIVSGDREFFASPVLRSGAPPQDLDLALPEVHELDLVVDVGGDDRGWDQADWADARVDLVDGQVIWLDDLATQAGPGPGLPVSFVYDGAHSSTFLHRWSRTLTVDRLADGGHQRTVTATDPETGLQVQVACRVYGDTPGTDWSVRFVHTGDAETPVLEQIQTLDACIATGVTAGIRVHRLEGSLCRADDWQPFTEQLVAGQRLAFAATHGRSANVSPFFACDWGTGGVITAIGWSGQWAAALSLDQGQLRLAAGQERVRLRLRPGEAVRGPRILQLYWGEGDYTSACNLFRRTMVAHIVPRVHGAPVLPPLAYLSTAFYELNRTAESNLHEHLQAARGLGFEVFWLDAYWTGPNGFPDSMGNYGLPLTQVEPADRFPHGVASFAAAVQQTEMGFLMWFEPERVAPGTRIAREHPEWVLSRRGDGSGLLDLGHPAARQALTEYLDAAIRSYHLSWLRIDYNIDPLPFWQLADERDPEHIGLSEIRYVEGLYRLWDDLLAAHPHLCIDNCASGGRRIDVEACSRSTPLWRSDNTCDMVGEDPAAIRAAAVKNQLMSSGLNRYVPFSTVGQMGVTPYFVRSGFNAGLAFCQDVRPAHFPRELMRQGLAEARRLRPYWFGDFYPLAGADGDPAAWCLLQYHRPESEDGVILAFRRHESPFTARRCRPRQIVATAQYRVQIASGYQPEPPVEMAGADLQELELRIAEQPGSVLVEYQRLPGTSG